MTEGDRLSSKRFVLIISGVSLSISTIILSVAACLGVEVTSALFAVTGPMCALAGVSYVAKKETAPELLDDSSTLLVENK